MAVRHNERQRLPGKYPAVSVSYIGQAVKMAKKDIITDFGALREMISFSEKPCGLSHPDTGTRPDNGKEKAAKRKNKPAESSQDNNFLKTGQAVVLMDSNLRGKITSISDKVTVRLEDGLCINVSYGEFATTDEAEIAALGKASVRPAKTGDTCIRQKRLPADATLVIDLHIEAIPGGKRIPANGRLQFQMSVFRNTIRQNLSHKGMTIKFIHGIGDGTLKAAIRKELDEIFSLRCSYSVGDPAVTIVTIR